MYVFELEFTLSQDREEKHDGLSPFRPAVAGITVGMAAQESISLLLLAWKVNGQVLGEEITTAVPGGYRVFVRVPAKDALHERHHSDFVRQTRGQWSPGDFGTMQVRPVGRDPDSDDECPGHPDAELILRPDVHGVESPLRCARCFGAVPLYTLPPGKRGDQTEITWWDSTYRACAGLRSRDDAAGTFAHREMEDPESDLSRDGREICARIAKTTGRRTWFYIQHPEGDDLDAECARRCPGCGGEWLLPATWLEEFHFRCDDCGLVSDLPLHLSAWFGRRRDDDTGDGDDDE